MKTLLFIIDLPFRFVFVLIGFTFCGWDWLGGNSPDRTETFRRNRLAVVGRRVAT
jgi:hypothetical protein